MYFIANKIILSFAENVEKEKLIRRNKSSPHTKIHTYVYACVKKRHAVKIDSLMHMLVNKFRLFVWRKKRKDIPATFGR